MTAEEFVSLLGKERASMLELYFSPTSRTAVGSAIAGLDLESKQVEALREIVGTVLTDAFYTVLLGLDGCASLGGKQLLYQLRDENGDLLTGDLESAAWEEFHGQGSPS